VKELVFISSVQSEFAAERKAIRAFIQGNRLLARHFDVFLFEDLSAKDRRPDELYLDKVDECAVFICLIGEHYGWEDPADGISPTEREFERATAAAKYRLAYLKNLGGGTQHDKMAKLTARLSRQLTYTRFDSEADLNAQVYDSLVEYLEERGVIRSKPFDAARCDGASLDDIAADKIAWFLEAARRERGLNLSAGATPEQVLTHLKLLEAEHPAHAAILLFGRDPQRFLDAAVVKCAHFHGSEIAKPIPSQQAYAGTLFEQVDQATDFVLARLRRTVGTRDAGAAAPVAYEIPRAALAEVIVNAVAHRDYASHAAVQVSVFSDRVEVANPGRLPRGLTPEHLRQPHSSEPPNPLITRPLYLAHYVESLGTGTLDVIRLCREARLPPPDFQQRGNQFVATLWRDWLTPETLAGLGLNPRQRKALELLRLERRISNARYRELTGASSPTAKRDLEDLVGKGLLTPRGAGRGAYYELAAKRLGIGSIGSIGSGDEDGNGS